MAPSLGPALPPTPAGRSWSDRYIARLIGADLIVGVASALAAFVVLDGERHLLLTAVLPFTWVLIVGLAGGYERRHVGLAGAEEYRAVGRALLYLFAGFSIISFSADLQLSRAYIGVALVVLTLGSLAVRKVARRGVARRRKHGECLQRTLVVGRSDSVTALVRSIEADPRLGLQAVAACAVDLNGATFGPGRSLAGVPIVGGTTEAIAAVDAVGAEVVAVASHPDLAGAALRRLAWALEDRDVELVVSPGLLDVAGPRMSIRPSNDLSLLHIERPASLKRRLITKTILDRTLSALALLALSPLLLAVAVLIKLDDGGPVFYRQQRVGVRGELFYMMKFRSMRVDADKMLADLRASDNGNGVLFKMQNDPRVTSIGRVLRRYSIDELPQLFNVLGGEMSLVGPRPPLPSEVLQYESDAVRRLHVRPGMTGLWQVSGRSDLSWEESLKLDLRYVDNWSPVTDLWIMVRTVRAVFGHEGAY
ncbi:MAG: sugar transferase [Mobilicoccus sp.]|nr:sugar transferase [Mobilicoccus sp.]